MHFKTRGMHIKTRKMHFQTRKMHFQTRKMHLVCSLKNVPNDGLDYSIFQNFFIVMFLVLKVAYQCVLKKNIKKKIKYHTSLSFIKQNVYKKRHAWDGFMKITFVIFNFFIFALRLLSQNCYEKILKTFNFKKHHIKVFEKNLFQLGLRNS